MRGFVKSKTTRVIGIIAVTVLALIIGIVTAVATGSAPAAQATGTSVKPTVTDNAPAGWNNTAVTVTLAADDTGGPGIAKTQYRLGGSSTWFDTTSNQFVVAAPTDHSNDGAHSYEYRALDTSGVASDTGSCTVKIDTTTPVCHQRPGKLDPPIADDLV